MKKIISILAAVVCAAGVTACSGGTAGISLEPEAVSDILASSVNFSEELTKISQSVILKRYGIDEALVEEASGYAGTQAVVDEIAVFKTSDTAAVEEKAQKRIETQKESYTSYAPNEVPKLDGAVITAVGDCVIVCVSEDTAADVNSIISELSK